MYFFQELPRDVHFLLERTFFTPKKQHKNNKKQQKKCKFAKKKNPQIQQKLQLFKDSILLSCVSLVKF